MLRFASRSLGVLSRRTPGASSRLPAPAAAGSCSSSSCSSAALDSRAFHSSPCLADDAPSYPKKRRGTTILCVRKGDKVVMAGDGMVSQGSMIIKHSAHKVRRIGKDNDVITGIAGATADALALREILEAKLADYPGQLTRAAVELAKLWRTDKRLRRLEAVLLVADKHVTLEVGGNGDVLSSDDGVLGIGSGGGFAVAAARALLDVDGMDADQIARKSMNIAADLCVYTNKELTVEELVAEPLPAAKAAEAKSDAE